jgi:hypothetical protein
LELNMQTDKIAAYLRWIMRTVNNFETKTGQGGWYAEEMQLACNAIAKETGAPVKFGISSYSTGFEHPTGDNPFPASTDAVPMPQNEDQAAGMVLIGVAWLQEHAPHRLKPGA